MDFSAKVAIVTGAGKGIGRRVSLALAARGARVVLAGKRDESINAVKAEIEKAGGEAYPIRTDVASGRTLRRWPRPPWTATAGSSPLSTIARPSPRWRCWSASCPSEGQGCRKTSYRRFFGSVRTTCASRVRPSSSSSAEQDNLSVRHRPHRRGRLAQCGRLHGRWFPDSSLIHTILTNEMV